MSNAISLITSSIMKDPEQVKLYSSLTVSPSLDASVLNHFTFKRRTFPSQTFAYYVVEFIVLFCISKESALTCNLSNQCCLATLTLIQWLMFHVLFWFLSPEKSHWKPFYQRTIQHLPVILTHFKFQSLKTSQKGWLEYICPNDVLLFTRQN